MILRRKEAIILSSFFKYLSLPQKERDDKIENALAEIELEPGEASEETANYYARKYIEYEFSFFINTYLQGFLSKKIGKTVEVKGKTRKLYPCLCCGYKTLTSLGEYNICKVCFWEDDGCDDPNSYSGPNKMTLLEAQQNFEKIGVNSHNLLDYLDPERMIQFEKE